ncbi:hypothetical protein BG261_02740 [Floricoccus tropicus]|uniref:HTH cro/C1-type domain-containing protein n=1 Tax=Floricoccus tropicus TaxID=1859473 RepID=A0A1E8GPH6_9LACT|nr:helix-turn-helix domain-containing protein [Floricoccus tropicus]OFI49513.1 hypothetical protein BG261_02740 [Floricoccus tropicus]
MTDKKVMDKYLEPYQITRNEVSNITGIPTSTLLNSSNREVKTWKVEVIQALAEVTNLTPGDTLNVLLALERQDDIKYTISLDELLKYALEDLMAYGPQFKVYPIFNEYKELGFKYISDYIYTEYYSTDPFDSPQERSEISKLNEEINKAEKSGVQAITIKELIDELEKQRNELAD